MIIWGETQKEAKLNEKIRVRKEGWDELGYAQRQIVTIKYQALMSITYFYGPHF